jgi:hypothetical protein
VSDLIPKLPDLAILLFGALEIFDPSPGSISGLSLRYDFDNQQFHMAALQKPRI